MALLRTLINELNVVVGFVPDTGQAGPVPGTTLVYGPAIDSAALPPPDPTVAPEATAMYKVAAGAVAARSAAELAADPSGALPDYKREAIRRVRERARESLRRAASDWERERLQMGLLRLLDKKAIRGLNLTPAETTQATNIRQRLADFMTHENTADADEATITAATTVAAVRAVVGD